MVNPNTGKFYDMSPTAKKEYKKDVQSNNVNPFELKNKHIRSKGPTPNTKRTIFAVLGVVFFSSFAWIILEVNFFFDFCLGILKIDLENHDSNNKLRVKLY